MPLRQADEECLSRDELFLPGTENVATAAAARDGAEIRLRRPTPGLQLAYDPRLPADDQQFEFEIAGVAGRSRRVTVDGREHEQAGSTYRFRVTLARVSDVLFSVK